uniref:Microfibril associated protein 5 n=1 Tax=Gadus morhua TaxID=8049 RepID=A0A8C5CVA2_GADMO
MWFLVPQRSQLSSRPSKLRLLGHLSSPSCHPKTEQGHADCSEQKYPCTRMYSVQRPMKKCVGSMCFYSLPRVYLINKEICTRILCDDDEFLQAERCREQAGWPKRLQRSTNQKRCQDHRGNLKTWANKP